MTKEQGLSNNYFLIDGDNEGFPSEFSGYSNLIKLSKYCIENYLLDYRLLSIVSGKTEDEVKTVINDIIKSKNDKKYKPFKTLAESNLIIENVDLLDTFDASCLFSDVRLYTNLGLSNLDNLIDAFIDKANDEGVLSDVFSEIIDKF